MTEPTPIPEPTNSPLHQDKAASTGTHSRSPLLRPNFILLMAGQGFSLFGNTMLRFALSMWVLDKTGSATIFSTLLSLSIVPTIILSPFGGVIADRVNRKVMMVALDAISGVVVLTAILGFATMQAHTIVAIGALLIVLSMLDAMESPTTSAAIPQMLGRSDETVLRQAQAVSSQLNAIMQIVPTFAGGALYAVLGIRHMLEITAICFFATAVFECFIRLTDIRKERGESLGTPLQDIKGAFGLLTHTPNLIRFMLLIAALNFLLSGISAVGMPFIIRTLLHFGADVYGYSDGIMSIVSLLGSFATLALATKLVLKRMPLTIGAAALFFAPIAVAFALPVNNWSKLVVYIVSLCFITLCIDFTNVMIGPSMIKLVPDDMMGKIGGLFSTFALCAAPLGQMAYGLLFDHMHVSVIMTGTGICLGLMAIVLTPTVHALDRDIDRISTANAAVAA